MEKITVPDQNAFEQRAKAFSESRLGRRLARKFTPKPYEQKRNGLYIVSWVGSFFCNLVAVITGSTFVFAYALGLLSKLPEPMLWAVLLAGIILVGMEALKQLLVPDLFQDWFQYGWKHSYFLQVVGIVILIGTSTSFNYFGGFDFAGAVSTPPVMEQPELKNADAVRREYQPKVDQVSKEAEQYRQNKLWNGKLSDASASAYRKLLDDKNSLEKQMLAKIDSVEAYNDRASAAAKTKHEEVLKVHEEKTQVKGRGLAMFSVVCEFLFLAFCWYRERYEYKTAIQYAGFGDEEEDTDPGIQSQIGNGSTPLPHQQHNNSNGVKGEATQRRPIGFHSHRQQESNPTGTQTQDGELIVLTKTYKNTEYLDTFTIEHKGKRYRLADVDRFCRTYRDRLKQAERSGNTNTAQSRRTQLEYWEGRRKELLAKIEEAGKQ
jgi:hypothetical protein